VVDVEVMFLLPFQIAPETFRLYIPRLRNSQRADVLVRERFCERTTVIRLDFMVREAFGKIDYRDIVGVGVWA
jgi:hypothetical protein